MGVRVSTVVRNGGVISSQLLWRDTDYTGDCYSADFDRMGHLAVASSDGKVRLYSAVGHRTALYTGLPNVKFRKACFSPDGTRLAVSQEGSPKISVLSGANLSLMYYSRSIASPDKTRFDAVCWSKDGSTLYGAGHVVESASPKRKAKHQEATQEYSIVRRWRDKGWGEFRDTHVGLNAVYDLQAMPDGGVVFATAVPSVGVLDKEGRVEVRVKPATIPVSRIGPENLRVNPRGDVIEFPWPATPGKVAHFDVMARKFALLSKTAASMGETLQPPVLRDSGLQVTHWKESLNPKCNGVSLPLRDPEDTALSLAVSSNQGRFVLGTGFTLSCFNYDGTLQWDKILPEVWAVNIPQYNPKVCIAALGDGTVRWYDLLSGQELCALYVHPDGHKWVLWTPDGFYDASPGTENLLGFYVNRSYERFAEWLPVSQFYKPSPRLFTTLLQAQN